MIYSRAFSEIKNGKKIGHWIWFIFPQIVGLGKSPVSRKYSIKSKEEAKAYFEHPILGIRLIEVCNTLLSLENKSAFEIFGHPDYMKVKSCLTLFHKCIKEETIFQKVLDKYYDERLDDLTLMILSTL